jgi:hypothetical protein
LNLDQQEAEWSEKQELTAISKASKIVYSSKWAADSAISDYQADADNVVVLPFGANLDNPPLAEEILSKNKCLLVVCYLWAKIGTGKGEILPFKL